ncbi:MAG: DNA-processing protein DprA [Candidatus Pacebacteria bacterium]|jgi:DNA processing protein|nr:DNA-processing protein DprA [Candidatus Paceibacterota bacterium]
MDTTIKKLSPEEFPEALREIPKPPKMLYMCGTLPPEGVVYLAVIGSRTATSYGKAVCEKLIEGLAGYPICIVSGLALGMDGIAHTKALAVGLLTVAFPGSGLSKKALSPATHFALAESIVAKGGALISEFAPEFQATIWSFPQRNRLIAGISRAVLIIEAKEKSGALITARLALDYNRDVFAVPGSVFSDNSRGTNALIRGGATVVLESADILRALGFSVDTTKTDTKKLQECSPEEIAVLKLLYEPKTRDDLIREMQTPTAEAQTMLSMMEIKGVIVEEAGYVRKN